MKRNHKGILYSVVAFLLLLISLSAFAQDDKVSTIVEGIVVDFNTSQPLQDANIYFKNNITGTTTNSEGKFKFNTIVHNDTLMFSMIGYKTAKVFVGRKKTYKYIIKLKKNFQVLNEVVVKPGENPSLSILRNIIKNKKRNNPEKFNRYSYCINTLLNATLSNITKNTFKFVIPSFFTKVLPVVKDSSGRTVLPFYWSEKVANNFIDHKANILQTNVINQKVKGIAGLDKINFESYNTSLSTEINFYKNYIDLFGHTFVSPLAKTGSTYYQYHLKDSTYSNGYTYYHINFVPRHKKDLVFSGNFVVVKDIWAITNIEAFIPKSANINYLNSFKVDVDFDFVNDSTLFFKSNSISASFHYFKVKNENKTAMIEFSKTTIYSNIKIGKDAIPLLNSKQTVATHEEHQQSDSILLTNREKSNIKSFEHISKIIDSTNNLWWMKLTKKIVNMFITSYYNIGKIDIGPYFKTFEHNPVEGTRLNLGIRTSEDFNPHYCVGGSIGYGFMDKEWKYSLYGQYKLNTKYRTVLGAGYLKDIYLLDVFSYIPFKKENILFAGEDRLITAAFKRHHSDRQIMLYRYNIYIEKEWYRGFVTRLRYEFVKIRQGLYVPFIHSGTHVNYIYNNTLSFRLRFSWKEKILDIFLRRYYFTTFLPIINIVGTAGRYSVDKYKGNYFKLNFSIKQFVPVGFTSLEYFIELGYIFGKVPFPMLEIVRGNDSYSDSKYHFNMLNTATAAVDKYASIMVEYHFNGLILNKIPLIRVLNLRTLISAKYIVGTLSEKHQKILAYPWNMKIPGNNYLELGIGLENVLQIFRIEAIWRLVPKVYPGMPYFGFRVRVDFSP